jgi:hypothetical protein
MKTIYNALAIIFGLLLLCGCTQTLYTHQQVLQKCRTRQDVYAQFGAPDEKHPGQGVEQWVYNMDKPHNPTKQKMPDQLKNQTTMVRAKIDSLSTDSVQNIKQEKYTKSLKFMFDDQGNVIGYKADGADVSRKVKDSFGKSLVNITGGIAIISVLVALELYKDGAFDN